MTYNSMKISESTLWVKKCAIIHCTALSGQRMESLWLAEGHSERGCGCFLVDHMALDQTVCGHHLSVAQWQLQLALKSKM